MRYLVAVLALTIGGAAHAQSSTTCSTIGNVTNCQHQPGAGVTPLDYGAMLRQGQALVPDYESERLSSAQSNLMEAKARTEQERLSCRRKAMKAIDAGEYEKAKALASLCP